MKKIRVIRIINRLNIGGPTYNAVYLTKFLEPDFETLLVSGMKDDTEGDSSFIARNYGIEPMFVKDMQREINPINDYKGYTEIKKIIQDYKPDIVHTHAAKAGALGRLAARACKVPVVLHTFHGHAFHSYFGPLKTRFFVEVEKYLASQSTAIVAISPSQKQELSEVYKICAPEKITVVPNGFDLSRFTEKQEALRKQFRAQYSLSENDIAIGIIGRLVSIKNQALFLKAFQKLKATVTEKIHGFIIGDGEDRAMLENLCQELGLSFSTNGKTDIIFTSWILDMERAYAGIDIVALTSLNEGTPSCLIEAQAASKPVVSTNVGAVQEVILPNVSGLMVPSGNVMLLTTELQKIVEQPALRKNMGAEGKKYVLQKYGYERLVTDMRNLYIQLLNTKNRF